MKYKILIVLLVFSSSCVSRINKYSNDDDINQAKEREVNSYKNLKRQQEDQAKTNSYYKQQYDQAYELSKNGRITDSIDKMEEIPKESPFYEKSLEKIEELKPIIKNEKDEMQYNRAYNLSTQDLNKALYEMKKISKTSNFYSSALINIDEWTQKIEDGENSQIYERAYNMAKSNDITSAILEMQKITSNSYNYKESRAKISEWKLMSVNKLFKSEYEKAISYINKNDLYTAIEELRNISPKSPYFSLSKVKLSELKTQIINKREIIKFNQAYKYANDNDLEKAIQKMKEIRPKTSQYNNAQKKIKEWNLLIDKKLKDQKQKEMQKEKERAVIDIPF
ncbi:MAG: hypothetical protein H7263_11355 [Candidatus Sericytochromatia bacterium]|nr:hypothetical protein [Candidatus Sericytochromatia bacterium]